MVHRAFHKIGKKFKNALLRLRVRHISRLGWNRWHQKVFGLHPHYKEPAPRDAERAHLALWRPLRRDVKLDTFRACYNMSGVTDPQIVPEEIYTSEIQVALNRYDYTWFLSNKSVLNRWLPEGLAPDVLLHNLDGVFLGTNYEPLSRTQVEELLAQPDYPVVIKPSMGSGGRDVAFPSCRAELLAFMEKLGTNYVVQRRIQQHPFFSRFSDSAVNTIRVCMYRSVRDEQMHYLNANVRMAKGGSLDNLNSGGIQRFIHPDGSLSAHALDNWGERFECHPDSGIEFTRDQVVPKFDALKRLAKNLARQVFLTRLVSFDFCLDEKGNWRVIEINLRNQTIQMAQYHGHPFFGPFTHEVIEYVKENPRWTVILPP